MSEPKLSEEERTLLRAVEKGGFESALTDERREELQAIATNTLKKDKRINIRISNRDLLAVQARASEQGIPYQTLASSIIHKYVSGTLRDLSAEYRLK